jgi:hypothetical protein
MSQLNSKFDLISEESFASPMSMAITLAISPTYGTSYTSTPASNTTFPAGTIVEMDSTGKAVVATGRKLTGVLSGSPAFDVPKLFAVVIDGSDTFTGAFTNKLTCLIGGFQMITTQFTGSSFSVGDALAVGAGNEMSARDSDLVVTARAGSALSGTEGKLRLATGRDQIFGYVGPRGYSAADGTLHVIVPHK